MGLGHPFLFLIVQCHQPITKRFGDVDVPFFHEIHKLPTILSEMLTYS